MKGTEMLGTKMGGQGEGKISHQRMGLRNGKVSLDYNDRTHIGWGQMAREGQKKEIKYDQKGTGG